MDLPRLFPSVKRATFRIHDDESNESDAEFVAMRRKALVKGRFTCVFCGFVTVPNRRAPEHSLELSGYMEVHHLDDDHSNNSLENLVVACPFCHQVFHAGFAGKRKAIRIVWLPHISQEDLNLLMNITLCAIRDGGRYKEKAEKLYDSLSRETAPLVAKFGEDILNPENLGQVLIGLDKEGLYEKRYDIFYGLRFLPEIDVFKNYIDWWLKGVWAAPSMWEGIAGEDEV